MVSHLFPSTPRFRSGLEGMPIVERRAGLIPCGGLVHPFAGRYALLVGDAAGLVSPLTGGGIHCAFRYGRRAALAVCDYLCDHGMHPGAAMALQYPSFMAKRLARIAMNAEPPNAFYNLVLGDRGFLALARLIYFHRRGALSDATIGIEAALESTLERVR